MKKPFTKLKFFALLLIATATMLMGSTTAFANWVVLDGFSTAECSVERQFTVEENCMRVYVKNAGTSNVKCYISKIDEDENVLEEYDPFIVEVDNSKTVSYETGVGDYELYIVNEDGSYLDVEYKVRELKHIY